MEAIKNLDTDYILSIMDWMVDKTIEACETLADVAEAITTINDILVKYLTPAL